MASDSTNRYSFQTWIENGIPADPDPHSNIWFTYGLLGSAAVDMTIGAESANGIIGDSFYYNGVGSSPVVGTDLTVVAYFGVVPVPAAFWLFGTALVGLAGFGKVPTKIRPESKI